jgi:hypothetical protein
VTRTMDDGRRPRQDDKDATRHDEDTTRPDEHHARLVCDVGRRNPSRDKRRARLVSILGDTLDAQSDKTRDEHRARLDELRGDETRRDEALVSSFHGSRTRIAQRRLTMTTRKAMPSSLADYLHHITWRVRGIRELGRGLSLDDERRQSQKPAGQDTRAVS